ncbi:hypothetical protein N7457_002319 [Penicillium paradoxum]|uniref:uncharacterized protein n=1 Tax=Penicillium paradoxum TaxID=176176 RepID=UPI002546BCC9|nr:uncharacterized protein N7457_002319 [Penicillium paradoxum]KAJ5787329.1 hypothetical protein N7457_002319 [Penicillium paradoxum]
MHFYSILVATLALAISTAFASDAQYQQNAGTDCLNICKEESNGYTCPPGTEKTQLSNGCWTCCDTE